MPRATADGYKDCCRCGESLPVAFYHKDKRKPDGLSYRCKDCDSSMRKPKIKNRTLYVNDNLRVMDRLPDDCIDLIATDPPFNSGRDYNAPLGSKAANQHFTDRWQWKDIQDAWSIVLKRQCPAVKEIIEAAAIIEGGRFEEDGSLNTGRKKFVISAFLCYMAPRLLEMRRILKPTGSIYLHCDSAANSYLRLLMDAVFGRKNFRNDIRWCYFGPSNVRRNFPRKSDTILFYSMSDDSTFNRDAVRVDYKVRLPDNVPVHGTAGDTARIAELNSMGKVPFDWWEDILPISHRKSERTGWATQKPVALYERIIKASSNPGDVVFDPFCGCSTTLMAAENLDRQWVGCDIDKAGPKVIKERRDMLLNSKSLLDEETQKDRYAKDIDVQKLPGKRNQFTDDEMREMLFYKQGEKCANRYCDSKPRMEDLELDHEIPKRHGGSDQFWNRIGLCSNCNRRKGGHKSWKKFLDEERAKLPHGQE